MNELVQVGFFESESVTGSNDEIIISAEWMSLSSDDEFKRTAIEHHRELDRQEVVIDVFKNRIIREKGELYIAAKARLKHGEYLDLLGKMGVEPRIAQYYAKLARDYREELLNAKRVSHLSLRQWIKIDQSSESKQIVAKIEDGKVEATPEAINAELEAAKKRADEAEAEAKRKAEEVETAQQQLFDLKQEMENLPAPEPEIREVEKPETKARLEQLETDKKDLEATIAKLTEQRDNLSSLADELSADLTANEAQREQEARDLRIRQEWQKLTDAMYKSVTKFIGQLPMPVDTQIFESEDWTRLEEVIQAFRSGIAACDSLRANPALMIVDAHA